MSVRKPRFQGKGDGRRDNLKAFRKGMDNVQIPTTWTPHGTVFLRKNNRTIVTYK